MSKNMKNFFEKIGKTDEQVKERVYGDFEEIFFGEKRIYHEETKDGIEYGYMVDTGNNDVRTEGQSYGMMIAVQLDRKDVFDRIWRWTKKYMLITEGDDSGYFKWSAKPDGTSNFNGPAPDGEEFFAMSLLFARNRWGDETYAQDAKNILQAMIHNKQPMFNPENKLVKFIPNLESTDPSYHLPHFYELWAKWGGLSQADSDFYKEAAKASREFWKICCHPKTGLSPEYANYDGAPINMRNHHLFYSDAYRTGANIALDAIWCDNTDWHKEQASALLDFFADESKINTVWRIDGTPADPEEQVVEPNGGVLGVLHPLGLASALAESAMLTQNPAGDFYLKKLWDSKPRTDGRRYYDNLLYMFALMALGGFYRIIE